MGRVIKDFNEYSEKTRLGADLFNNKKYEEALNVFLELSEYNKTNYKVFETLALIYIKLNNINAADEAYKTALRLYSAQSNNKLDIKTFDEAVSQLESIDTLMAMYENESASRAETQSEKGTDSIHRLPVMIGMQYMAKGEFKKAEELLSSHKNKYFK